MLESIRNGAQSFGVKVAFGIIILVFVFWGIGNFNDRDYSNVVAMVNGQPIVAAEFEKAYRNAEEFMLRQNPGLTREQLDKAHLGRQVLNELIQLTLINQEARRGGIAVTPVELRQHAEQIKAFQDENGKFDPEAYKRVLAARRTSPPDFEKELSDQLLRDKVYQLVTAPAWMGSDEARKRYDFIRERRVLDYLFLPAAEFASKVEIGKDEPATYYEEHKAEFADPARVEVEYIAVNPEAMAKPEEIGEEEARKWHQDNISKFNVPERVRASHILVQIPADADEAAEKEAREKIEKAREQIIGGRKFAEVADEINTPRAGGKGGELGWIGRGSTVPEFEEAAFALKPGEISRPVRTQYGFHLIRAEEKEEGGIKPFETVMEEAKKGAAVDRASDNIHDVLDNLVEDNILQKPMAESAAKYGLEVKKTGLLDQAGLIRNLGVSPDGAAALLATPRDAPLDTALDAGKQYIVARILESTPAGTKPFENVAAEIDKILRAEKSLALAMERASKLRAELVGKNAEEARKLGVKTSEPLEREAPLPGFAPNMKFDEAVFAAPVGEWLPQAFSMNDDKGPGSMVVKTEKIIEPDGDEFASVAEIVQNGLKQQRKDELFSLFLQNLGSRAKIEIVNPDMINRKNM